MIELIFGFSDYLNEVISGDLNEMTTALPDNVSKVIATFPGDQHEVIIAALPCDLSELIAVVHYNLNLSDLSSGIAALPGDLSEVLAALLQPVVPLLGRLIDPLPDGRIHCLDA